MCAEVMGATAGLSPGRLHALSPLQGWKGNGDNPSDLRNYGLKTAELPISLGARMPVWNSDQTQPFHPKHPQEELGKTLLLFEPLCFDSIC